MTPYFSSLLSALSGVGSVYWSAIHWDPGWFKLGHWGGCMCGLGRRRREGWGCVGSGVLEEIEVKVLSARNS